MPVWTNVLDPQRKISWEWPKNEDNMKNVDDLKNEDNLKKKDNLKNADSLKKKDTLKIKTTPKRVSLKNGNDLKNYDDSKIWLPKNEDELKVEKWMHIEDSSLAELIQAQSYLFTL